jgi:hypothetical protein
VHAEGKALLRLRVNPNREQTYGRSLVRVAVRHPHVLKNTLLVGFAERIEC